MKLRLLFVAAAVTTVLTAEPAGAQSGSDLLQLGIRAYGDIELEAAAAFLRRAVAAVPGRTIEPAEYAEALAYLGATEYFRGNPDAAVVAFRRLVAFDVRYRPDRLVFPPEVTNYFDEVRRETKAVNLQVPDDVELRIGADQISLNLHASSFHEVTATIDRADGTLVRELYNGPIADSLAIAWEGLNTSGDPTPSGAYTLSITSRDPVGRVLRVVQVPVDVVLQVRDTLPHPEPPADSLRLPERASAGPGVRALAGGVLVGAAVMLVPSAISADGDLSGTRFMVGGAISIAGIAGYFSQRPGRTLQANVSANQALTREWQEQLDSVIAENAARASDVRLQVRFGSPRMLGGPGP